MKTISVKTFSIIIIFIVTYGCTPPGNKLLDIARAVQINAEANGFGVVRELVGHGVGYAVHEAPAVPNFYDSREEELELED